MRVLHGEGVASHTGPESCGHACEGMVEALTGERAGWVIEPEILIVRDADALISRGKAKLAGPPREGRPDPAGSKTPTAVPTATLDTRSDALTGPGPGSPFGRRHSPLGRGGLARRKPGGGSVERGLGVKESAVASLDDAAAAMGGAAHSMEPVAYSLAGAAYSMAGAAHSLAGAAHSLAGAAYAMEAAAPSMEREAWLPEASDGYGRIQSSVTILSGVV
jgi:hypothetical protein